MDGRCRVTITNPLKGTFGGAIIIGGDGGNKYTATNFRFPNVAAIGGAGNDTIDGSHGIDFIFGGDGNDRIDGGGSNDGLEGADGNDTLSGQGAIDTLVGGAGTNVFDAAIEVNETYTFDATRLIAALIPPKPRDFMDKVA